MREKKKYDREMPSIEGRAKGKRENGRRDKEFLYNLALRTDLGRGEGVGGGVAGVGVGQDSFQRQSQWQTEPAPQQE